MRDGVVVVYRLTVELFIYDGVVIVYRLTVVLFNYELIKECFVTKGIQCAGRPEDPRMFAMNPHFPVRRGKQ